MHALQEYAFHAVVIANPSRSLAEGSCARSPAGRVRSGVSGATV